VNIDELERSGIIKRLPIDRKKVNDFLKEEDVIAFDRMRRKRHTAVYDTVGSISRAEAENALSRAEKFILEVEMLIKSE